MKYVFGIIFLLGSLLACSDKDDTSMNLDPSNLVVEIIVASDNSGTVSVTATALNTTEFHFFMGEESGMTHSNSSGIYEHIYQETGNYTVEVRAYNSEGRFVKKERVINVIAGDPTNTGEGYSTPLNYEGMTLIWSDEFTGTNIDPNKWSHDIGNGCPNLCGWGNNELEYYRKENSRVENGVLVIEAKKEQFQGSAYTSSKILTRDKFDFKYGRVDARARLPKGQGLWPAIWMLGANHSTVGWPSCGEIDIMEMIGGSGRERTSHGNVFWDDEGVQDFVGEHSLNSGYFYDEYHVFSIIWNASKITWYVDDIEFHSFDITDNTRSEFRNNFFLIVNVAVGGNWPGNPDNTTLFPTDMKVDYIRVFQDN